MFVELWAERKATPRLFERHTIDCLRVMFFSVCFCLLSNFSRAVAARFAHFDK
jgi:hypothetical protein